MKKNIQPQTKKLRMSLTVATSPESEAGAAGGDWAWFPGNIQDMILNKLVSLADYTRYGAVCKSWLNVSLETINNRLVRKHNHNHQLPMLMIPHRFDENKAGFYSVTREQILKFELSVPYHQRFIGSSFGWVVFIDTNSSIKLFNPFLPVTIDWTDNTFDFSLDDIELNHEYYFVKAVLSADPNLRPDDYVLMVIHSECRRIAFVRPQGKPVRNDQVWGCLSPDVKGFSDIMYSNDAFYALHEDGQVWIIKPPVDYDGDGGHRYGDGYEDGDDVDIVDTKDIKDALTISPPLLNSDSSCFARYIVEGVKGEILQVLRYGEPSTVGFPSCSTHDFRVFKLDGPYGNWIELKSLGDQVLFVGDNASLSVLASDYPGCQPGAIYYSFGFHPEILDRILSDDITENRIDIAAFNLENRTIRPCNMAYDHALCFAMHQFPPIWVVPTFQTPDLSSKCLKS